MDAASPSSSLAVVVAIAGAGSGLGTAATGVPGGASSELERHNAGQESRRPPPGIDFSSSQCISRRGAEPTAQHVVYRNTYNYGKIPSLWLTSLSKGEGGHCMSYTFHCE